jgi:nitrate reductase beta subunit
MEVSRQFNPRPPYPTERAHDTHWKGAWVETRDGLDALEKTETSYPCGQSNHYSSDTLPVAEDYISPAPVNGLQMKSRNTKH